MPLTLRPSTVLLATLLAVAGARASGPATYALDPVHTRVQFAIDHAGFSKALGTVSGSTGTLRFDPEDWRTASLQAEVPLDRLDLGDAKWNRAALARNLLDVETHPVARFTSTRIEPLSPGRACVHGELELHGVSREVVLDVRLNALGRYPLPPFRRTVGFSATTTISRADFGITSWRSLIGDRIDMRIEAEATRTRARPGDAEPEDVDEEREDANSVTIQAEPGELATRDLSSAQADPVQDGPAAPVPASATPIDIGEPGCR